MRHVIVCTRLYILAVASCVCLVGCNKRESAADYSGLGDFDSTDLSIVTSAGKAVPLRVEIAATESQKQLGLMERRELPSGRGMIFVYDSVQDPESSFWMYRTRIPLDIVFIDSAGRVAAIKTMAPCESPNSALCPLYPAGVRFSRALELPAGFTGQHNIRVGDRVLMESATSTQK